MRGAADKAPYPPTTKPLAAREERPRKVERCPKRRYRKFEVMLALCVPPTEEVVSPVRHRVRDWLAGAGYRGEGAYDVLVVVSELVSNGVIHDGGNDIEISLSKDDTGISIEVITIGQPSGREARRVRNVTGPAETGRGLLVVDALSDVLSIEDREGRHHVTCHVAIEDPAGPLCGCTLGQRRR